MDLPVDRKNTSKLRIGKHPGMVVIYLVLAFFAVPHLIDDFLFGIPVEFGLSNWTAQILAGIFILLLMIIFGELVKGHKRGLYGAISMGIFLALAGILKHLPLMLLPGPYWSGWFSEALILGLIFSGLTLAILTDLALRRHSPAPGEEQESSSPGI